MKHSRRQFLRLAAAAIPAVQVFRNPDLAWGADPPAKTGPLAARSVYGGVQVGIIAPYSLRGVGNDPQALLQATVKLGLSAVELQSEGFEAWAGAPAGRFGGPPGGPGGSGRGRGGPAGPGGRGAGPGGGGPAGFPLDLPGLSEEQRGAVREINESLASRSQTLTAARTELTRATFASGADAADIKRKAEAVAAAELDFAQARSEAFSKLQASANKLSAPQ